MDHRLRHHDLLLPGRFLRTGRGVDGGASEAVAAEGGLRGRRIPRTTWEATRWRPVWRSRSPPTAAPSILQAPGQQKIGMEAAGGDVFLIRLANAEVTFERDDSGAVISLVLDPGRQSAHGASRSSHGPRTDDSAPSRDGAALSGPNRRYRLIRNSMPYILGWLTSLVGGAGEPNSHPPVPKVSSLRFFPRERRCTGRP